MDESVMSVLRLVQQPLDADQHAAGAGVVEFPGPEAESAHNFHETVQHHCYLGLPVYLPSPEATLGVVDPAWVALVDMGTRQ